jgi:malate dehydrogenase (oxaloacetate-decarboxylating)(NADP+)
MNEESPITKDEALEYHKKNHKYGKVSLLPTKPLVNQRDLALAYSPGVAYPCLEIAEHEAKIYEYTAKGNVVAVISNGTAVLGLGNLGAAASKPVMEGKAVLFKKFADIDAIDIEVNTENPEEFINAVKYLGKSWGGINLEDIKAPECFIIEERLQKLMDIPVFHDDQHGTAIITAAALINAVHITNREIKKTLVVINGAGSASIACAELLVAVGFVQSNIIMCDTKGVIYLGRKDGMNEWKERHANSHTKARTLAEAMFGADVFIGLSVKDAVTQEMVASMEKTPIIFAMANPDPEITPEKIKEVRKDAIIATGRSDYNNQVNNVMGFPYIFRGALDVMASKINLEMKIAAVHAIANLTKEPVPDDVMKAYSGRKMKYGPEYIIPVPFDPRLITTIPIAVAKAAIESGVARKQITDFKKYKKELGSRLDPTSNLMNFVFERIYKDPQKIILAEGEEEDVIKAAIIIHNNNYGIPILIGRENIVHGIMQDLKQEQYIEKIQVMNAAKTDNLEKYIAYLYQKLQRKGCLYRDCASLVKKDKNIFSSCMLACGDGDAMVTGVTKSYISSLEDVSKVIDQKRNSILFSYSILISQDRNLIIADDNIHEVPTSKDLSEISIQIAKIARGFGYTPRVAFMSYSNFGDPQRESAERIKEAVGILDKRSVDFEYDGEMTPAVALNKKLMSLYPFCRLSDTANILIMPALHSASISVKLLKELSGGAVVGPILTGLDFPVQIARMSSSSSDIVNLAAFAALDALNR